VALQASIPTHIVSMRPSLHIICMNFVYIPDAANSESLFICHDMMLGILQE